jgi:hypothetical protein
VFYRKSMLRLPGILKVISGSALMKAPTHPPVVSSLMTESLRHTKTGTATTATR